MCKGRRERRGEKRRGEKRREEKREEKREEGKREKGGEARGRKEFTVSVAAKDTSALPSKREELRKIFFFFSCRGPCPPGSAACPSGQPALRAGVPHPQRCPTLFFFAFSSLKYPRL